MFRKIPLASLDPLRKKVVVLEISDVSKAITFFLRRFGRYRLLH